MSFRKGLSGKVARALEKICKQGMKISWRITYIFSQKTQIWAHSKLKVFTDDKLNVREMIVLFFYTVGNIVGKVEKLWLQTLSHCLTMISQI